MNATPWDLPTPEPVEDPPPADLDACSKCDGTGGVPVGPGLVPWELEYDACPECRGTGRRGAAA